MCFLSELLTGCLLYVENDSGIYCYKNNYFIQKIVQSIASIFTAFRSIEYDFTYTIFFSISDVLRCGSSEC